MMDSAEQASPEKGKPNFLVVGLGGSAGAITSFRDFFRNVPADSGMAYVVILHLSPEHDSRLAEVLQSAAAIPVLQVREAVKVQPDHVYVIPPNKSLAMSDGTLMVADMQAFEERRAPIDIFFRTLADTHDSRAISIVMSGSGSDGSMGLRRVKEYNGLVLVQDPSEAAFGEMPRSAIATGLADYVVPAAEMPGQIAAYRNQLHSVQSSVEQGRTDDDVLIDVFTTLRLRTGHDFTNYKRSTVIRRIERRLAVREVASLGAYVDLLRQDGEEAQALVRELLISVTNFFRDSHVWQKVESAIIPRLLEKKSADDQLRIWVAGCATGEEAYSIAMLLAEKPGLPDVQIFATDLDDHAIGRARNGLYNDAEVADVPPERLRRFFVRDQDGYRVRREIRELVLFAHHNLIKDPPFSHLDFISCRNLLIYLNRTAQQRAMEVMHFALEPGGFLLLGTAESVDGSANLFSVFDKDAHIYQSRAVPRVVNAPSIGHTPPEFRPPSAAAEGRASLSMKERLAPADLHHRLLEQYAPPSIVIDEEYEIVHLSERAGRYLQFSAGEASVNLLQVIRSELRFDLRSTLFHASQKRTPVAARGLTLHTGERMEKLDIIVRPVIRTEDPATGFFLVVFEESKDREEPLERPTATDPAARQMEEELIRVKSQVRATIEQYEVQAEEAKAANEELQAMNEELRSTAEELETSQEELQSVNEELQTVNQELKVKIDEVGHTNDDLRNLMSSTEIGTIFVDRSLRVKLFTPRVRDIFNLIPADVGRPLLDIANRLAMRDLGENIERVLERLQTVEREVETREGAWYLMRLLPYRTSDDRIDGVVLTFFDITERRRAQEEMAAELQATRTLRQLGARIDSEAQIDILYRDILRAAIDLTHADAGTVQLLEEDTRQLVLLAHHGFDETLISHFARIDAESSTALTSGERTTIDFDDPSAPDADGARLLHLEAGFRSAQSTPLLDRSGKPIGMLSTHWRQHRRPIDGELRHLDLLARQAADLIEKRLFDVALRESEARLHAVADLVPDLLWSNDASGRVDWINARWFAYTGQTFQDAAGAGWIDVIHPDDRTRSSDNFTRAIQSGQPLRQEHRIRSAAGEYRWFLVQAEPLRDPSGRIVRWFGTATDVHEQRAARERLEERVRERTRELADLSSQRQHLLERLVSATEQERQRIARELHDEMGQHITALKVTLGNLKSPDGAVDRMKDILTRLDTTVDRLALELRPPALDDMGLYAAITSLAEQFTASSGIRVDLHLAGIENLRLPDATETTLYRVVQEALTNVSKHAAARNVSIIVERQKQVLQLIVEDDGTGFDESNASSEANPRGRLGLLGIRERLSVIGGNLGIESTAETGTTLYVRVPLAGEA